jgi:alginate O-acetyltransferase complex protein AlgI
MIQSLTFWIVLLVTATGHWLIPPAWRMRWVAAMSMGYIASLSPISAAVLAVWTLAFFYLAPRTTGGGPVAGRILWGLILAILAYLAVFKYLPPVLGELWTDALSGTIAIPLGISYFTFKFIHYAVETSRGNITDRSLGTFFAYIFLFPIFTAGPIERFDHFVSHRDAKLSMDSIAWGVGRIVHGLIKKLVVAELLLRPLLKNMTIHDLMLQLEVVPTYKVWAYVGVSFLIVYLDFSAYSDIAIGSSRLMGLRIMENFNLPIVATQLSGFWKRWHISLSNWCQTYVYMPVIGMSRNPYLATAATFIVMGLWHAGTMNRVAWGLYHALGVSVYVTWMRIKRQRKWMTKPTLVSNGVGLAMTQMFIIPSTVFLLVENELGVMEAMRILAKMAFIVLPGGGA